MSGSWTGGCPCKDCNFKTKNSYPLVNYIQNCNYGDVYMSQETKQKKTDELLPIYWMCKKAKRCLNKGCDFRSPDAWDVMMHIQKCRDQLPIDHILFNELCRSYTRWEAATKNKSDSNARGKKLTL